MNVNSRRLTIRIWALASGTFTLGTMLSGVICAVTLDALAQRPVPASVTTLIPGFVYASATVMKVCIVAGLAKEAISLGGAEFREARKVVLGDVDGDGDDDAVAQYTIEGMGGGNGFAQMLTIFTNQKGVYRFATQEVVGGKFAYRTSKLTNIENGKIILSTETCAEPPQGLCDNPKKGHAIFTFNKGNLKEL